MDVFHELGWKNQPGSLGVANCLAEEPAEDPPKCCSHNFYAFVNVPDAQLRNSFLVGAVPFSMNGTCRQEGAL